MIIIRYKVCLLRNLCAEVGIKLCCWKR